MNKNFLKYIFFILVFLYLVEVFSSEDRKSLPLSETDKLNLSPTNNEENNSQYGTPKTEISQEKVITGCLILAGNTYSIPPAILVGIYSVEGGKVGERYNENGSYLGLNKINSKFIPELIKHWNVNEKTAENWLVNDACTNFGVLAWLLREEMDRVGTFIGAIESYYAKSRGGNKKESLKYRESVIQAIKDNGLIRDDGEITFDKQTNEISVLVNGKLELDFVVDSGASEVSIPAEVFMTLLRTRTITEHDMLPSATFSFADGSKKEQKRFMIREIAAGTDKVYNVEATVSDVGAPLLLGQSFLKKFSSFEVDNKNNKIRFEQ